MKDLRDSARPPFLTRRSPKAARISLLAVVLASCSLRNLDDLGPGTHTTGIAGNTSHNTGQGGVNTSGGTQSVGSTSFGDTGGTAIGGTAIGGNTDSGIGGAGGAAGNATAAAGQGGHSPVQCPLYVGTGGTLVTPPTNGFESDMLDWGRTAAMSTAAGLSLITDDSSACEGKGYLFCDGESRTASWDGPAMSPLRFMQIGHKYAVTAAVRFDDKTPQTGAGQTLGFTMGYWCDAKPITGDATEYANLGSIRASTGSWARLKGTFSFPPTCKDPNSVTKMQIYFETAYGVDTAVSASFHVDDFQLIDLTGAAGASGTAGAAGAPSTSAAAGYAGSASGGASSSH